MSGPGASRFALRAVSCPPRLVDAGLGVGAEVYAAWLRGTTDYWRRALERQLTPAGLLTDALNWWSTSQRRDRPVWASRHRVVAEWPIARLRDFTAVEHADDPVVPTLVLPPQAGHDSCIVDFSTAQSQIATIQAAGLTRVASLDWIGATAATRDTGVGDYLAVVDAAAVHLGGRVNLIGDCQGGWLAVLYAALHPERVNTLTIAGAPVDFHAGQAAIHDWVSLLAADGDLRFYRAIVAANDGVLPGQVLLGGFMAMQPAAEIDRQLQLLARLDDTDHVRRYAEFERWFQHTQAIPGGFYLWIVEHLFAGNELILGSLTVEGQPVDLARISCPVVLLAGAGDHITPPEQVFALAGAVSTPAGQITRLTTTGGHLGLFMGHHALEQYWPRALAPVLAASRA
ncbi:alpha/beta fold hydrolase [soil metagenome]